MHVSARPTSPTAEDLGAPWWRASVDGAPVGHAVVDLDGRFVHVNAALGRHLGRSTDELISLCVADVVWPGDLERAERGMARLGLGLTDFSEGEPRFVRPGGEVVRLHVTVTPIIDAASRTVALSVWWYDRSADLAAASALQAATEQLEIVAASSPLAIYLLDVDGVVVSWNKGAERMFGWSEAEAVGHRLPCVPPGQHHADEMQRQSVIEGTSYAGRETTRLRKDGASIELSISATPLRDADGVIVGAMGIAEDITARKAAAAALEASEHRLATLLANITDTVSLVDGDGTILHTSRGSDRIFGYDEEFWQSRSIFDVCHPDDMQAAAQLFAEIVALPGTEGSGLFRGRHADGSWAWVELIGANLLHDPAVRAVVVTSRNVDDRVRAELLQAGHARILELIARSASLDETLHAIVELVDHHAEGSRTDVVLDALGPAPDGAWSTPIVAESSASVIGRLTTTYDEPGRAPSDHERRVAATAARLAAIAVERAEAEELLAHHALHDSLTGLPNRSLLLDRLDHALGRAARSGRTVALLFLDLDRFKVLNDSLGHGAGDVALREVARRLSAIVRPGDTVARFGGDEFVVLCEDVTDAEHAARVAERVRSVLADPVSVLDDEVVLTASVGIAVAHRGSHDGDALLRDADAAMYRAKDLGRDRHEVFDDAMRARATESLRLEGDLRRAVDAGEVTVAFQPVVCLASGRIVGAEALARWMHPERGAIPPLQFVPIAEETGLIVALGWSVLDQAVAHAARWPARPDGTRLAVAVNVSARQLLSADVGLRVKAVLDRHDFPPEALTLELTESVLVDAPGAAEALRELEAIGVGVAIDDFGTGYSSLSYLHTLPVDIVKVDRAFVNGLAAGDGADDRAGAIATAIVQVCAALGLTASAEGVERPEQLARLRELGVARAQGYLFSPPVPPDDFTALLAEDRRW